MVSALHRCVLQTALGCAAVACDLRRIIPLRIWHVASGMSPIAGTLLLLSAVQGAELTTLRGETMGTSFSVKVPLAEEDDRVAELSRRIQQRLADIDLRMSTYRPDSDLSRFNVADVDAWFPVDAETATVVQRSLEISRLTKGAFDPTVGPLVRLWNFGAVTSSDFQLPTEMHVERALRRVGADLVEVRLDPPALKKSTSGVELDLSAIAKGYGVDQLAEILIDLRFDSFLVEIGGEMRLRGKRPDGGDWTVGVESPTRGQRELYAVVPLGDTAIASSGDYRNYFEYNGETYSHTIDPATGRPVRHRLAAVTVLAADCATADAFATAMLVMGPERAENWAGNQGVAALLLSRLDDGEIVERRIGEFETLGMTSANANQETTMNSFTALFIPALVIFGVALLGMSIGVIVSNRRIKGSCGGLAGITDDKGRTLCDGCTRPSPDCTGEPEA